MATGSPFKPPTQSPAGAGALPDHPLKSARVPSPSGTEEGALTRTWVPTGRWISQGVLQLAPSTVTVRLGIELVTVRCPTGVYVAASRTLVPDAPAGTVKLWAAGPPFDQLANAQMRPCESVCCAGACRLWVSPSPQMKFMPGQLLLPSTVRLKPAGEVDNVTVAAGAKVSMSVSAAMIPATLYAWFAAPPSLHEEKTHQCPV